MTNKNTAPTITLSNGVEMPALGLGTWPMTDAEAEKTIPVAIEAGYRLIDSAENYRNEAGVGAGVRASGIDRSEVFITTKFNVRWHSIEGAQEIWAESARLMGVDYIDLLLIHWPNPAQNRYVEAWKGMIRLLEAGKVRAIGTSNFKPAHTDRLIADTGVAPHVNQVQLNPYIPRAAERTYDTEHGIVTETWAPLAKGGDLFNEPAVGRIAERLGKTPAQVILRWHVQQGLLPIPKSSNPQRLAENIAVFDFELTDEDMAAIATLDRKGEGAVDSDRIGH
jgi:2,5-diketo-D-gluconate reductase A